MADVLHDVVLRAIERAVFGGDHGRRAFLEAVGATTAVAALASVFPLQAGLAIANARRALRADRVRREARTSSS